MVEEKPQPPLLQGPVLPSQETSLSSIPPSLLSCGPPLPPTLPGRVGQDKKQTDDAIQPHDKGPFSVITQEVFNRTDYIGALKIFVLNKLIENKEVVEGLQKECLRLYIKQLNNRPGQVLFNLDTLEQILCKNKTKTASLDPNSPLESSLPVYVEILPSPDTLLPSMIPVDVQRWYPQQQSLDSTVKEIILPDTATWQDLKVWVLHLILLFSLAHPLSFAHLPSPFQK
eukprot:TRINITY_DN9112_c0_g2_i7.p1 TRINITY_DN9112_c0_g2~~TRINITY_DN9112_c0_g2_i7.p1  ORF type:complete len:228 (+),score=54.19 TRINITY_DN9112_c0_g2_i7:901-1584(+)